MAHGRDPRRLAETVAAALSPQPVALAYLFGSRARGTADAESDIDIAVLADWTLTREERFELRLCLTRELADVLHLPLERVDLVILQDAPVLLRYNAIRGGVVLFARDPSLARAYAVAVAVEQQYEDEAPFLEREAVLTVDRILTLRA